MCGLHAVRRYGIRTIVNLQDEYPDPDVSCGYFDRSSVKETEVCRRLGVRYVFLVTLDPYEIDYVWHNARGFPIEDEWAAGDTAAFRLVYENSDVRIYEVTT